ncbi:MAG: type 4b pilus protein PilO2 [Pseudomonadota bacterium]|nr:type 4b pilus protein PilO2 [Pseudomonadota bacterium]
MLSIQIGKKKFVAGLSWRYPVKPDQISKEEIGRICSEVAEDQDVFGILIKARFEQVGHQKAVIARSGIGLMLSKSDVDNGILKKAKQHFSLAHAFSLNYPNAIAVFNLGNDEQAEQWWFCASHKGVPVPGTDVLGEREAIINFAKSFCNGEASVLYSNHPHISFVGDAGSIAHIVGGFFEQEITNVIGTKEDVFSSLSKPVARIYQIKGIDREKVLRVAAVIGVPIFIAVLYFGIENLTEEPPAPPVVSKLSLEYLNKIAEAKKAEDEAKARSEEQKNQEFMRANLNSKMIKGIETIITQKNVDWPIKAIDTAFKLPYQSSGYKLNTINCKADETCLVNWGIYGDYGDPAAFRTLLSKYSEIYPVVNDYAAKWMEKRVEFDAGHNRTFNEEDLRKLPVLNFFLNELIEKLNFSKVKGGVVNWKVTKPQQVPFYSDLPFKGFRGEVLNDSYISGQFNVSLNRAEYLEPFIQNVLSTFPYIGIQNIDISMIEGTSQIKIGGTYVATSK